MIFDKNNIPFFNDLEKTNIIVNKDNINYYLYTATNWDIAQKIDALMGNELGYDIDEFLVNKNKQI